MTEAEFQVVKSVGFIAALSIAVTMQRLRPHRTLTGSWRTNAGLWAVNAAVLGAVCGGCAYSASLWASGANFGLLNQGAVSPWIAIPVSVIAWALAWLLGKLLLRVGRPADAWLLGCLTVGLLLTVYFPIYVVGGHNSSRSADLISLFQNTINQSVLPHAVRGATR